MKKKTVWNETMYVIHNKTHDRLQNTKSHTHTHDTSTRFVVNSVVDERTLYGRIYGINRRLSIIHSTWAAAAITKHTLVHETIILIVSDRIHYTRGKIERSSDIFREIFIDSGYFNGNVIELTWPDERQLAESMSTSPIRPMIIFFCVLGNGILYRCRYVCVFVLNSFIDCWLLKWDEEQGADRKY